MTKLRTQRYTIDVTKLQFIQLIVYFVIFFQFSSQIALVLICTLKNLNYLFETVRMFLTFLQCEYRTFVYRTRGVPNPSFKVHW